ncbi:hypothetical protein [Rhizobium johnstonii]|uniref:hypothetical protein n=1 Tax=Rhizobium johnstonii TaxID=3019933 RepID=UPI002DDD0A46|nr:hypothetical protein U8P72_21270 [Rhizobium johnstonii]
MNNETWLDRATKSGQAWLLEKYGKEVLTGQVPETLPGWRETSSVPTAKHLTDTGAAILVKSDYADDSLPRVQKHVAILRAVSKSSGFRKTVFVFNFLKTVVFWHHQSTDGRWNCVIDRYERWGVRPVEEWSLAFADVGVSERTFHSVKDWAINAGLIEAIAAKHAGIVKLWIKPTVKLSRLIFETGYWEQIEPEFKPIAVVKPQTKKAAPRGLSAKYAAISAELRALYTEALMHDAGKTSPQETWEIWNRLTKPTQLSKTRQIAAFAPENSYRRKRLFNALGLKYLVF